MKESNFVTEIIDRYIKDEELRELLITHSRCVAEKALAVAESCGKARDIDRRFVYDAAMLHDIGIVHCDAPSIHCYGTLPYICHGMAGASILKREGLEEKYRRVCERHTGSGLTAAEIRRQRLPLPEMDLLPETTEEKLICFADKFFSKSSNPAQEKSPERVRASILRHGPEAYERFLRLEEEFRPLQTNRGEALL